MSESSKASESKRDAEAEKEAAKRAERRAEWDAADIEAFLAADRGEKLLRGEDGSVNHETLHAARQAEREQEFSDDED